MATAPAAGSSDPLNPKNKEKNPAVTCLRILIFLGIINFLALVYLILCFYGIAPGLPK